MELVKTHILQHRVCEQAEYLSSAAVPLKTVLLDGERRDQASTDNTETTLGFNIGGGVEYFLNRTLAVKGDGGLV